MTLLRRKPKTVRKPRMDDVIVRPAQAAASNDADDAGQELPRRRVPLDQRKPGWPKVTEDVKSTDSYYEVRGIKVIGFITVAHGIVGYSKQGLSIGWDICGVCKLHFKRCRCAAVSAPSGVVYVFRTTEGITYEPGNIGGHYIGLRHNLDGTAAPMVFDSPLHRAMNGTNVAVLDEPVTKKIVRRKPTQAVSTLPRRKPVKK